MIRMSSTTNAVRVEGTGEESSSPEREAVSQPKAKKGYIDEDYHGFFIENNVPVKFTTYRGVRYVHILPIVVEKSLTTIGSSR